MTRLHVIRGRTCHNPLFMEPSRRGLLVVLMFACVFDLFVAHSMSRTFDEPSHLEYGTNILEGQPDRSRQSLDSKMPITALNALPGVIGAHFDNTTSPRLRNFF